MFPSFCPSLFRCALQAVRALILAAGYSTVVASADQENCWNTLGSTESFYLGIISLTRWDCSQSAFPDSNPTPLRS